MPRPTITFPTILAAVAAGEHDPQTVALCAATGLAWADLLHIVDPVRPARSGARAWSDAEYAWMLRLTDAGCSQSLISRVLQRPRSGISYAMQYARGTPRAYQPTGNSVGRPRGARAEVTPPRRNLKAEALLREQQEWMEALAAVRLDKRRLHAARGRV